MNRTEELKQKLKEYPDRELIFMYPEESSDHAYTLGYPNKIIVDEYYVDDERVWLRDDNIDELIGEMEDRMMFQHYRGKYDKEEFLLAVELKKVEELAQKEIDSINWKKCIVVYIEA